MCLLRTFRVPHRWTAPYVAARDPRHRVLGVERLHSDRHAAWYVVPVEVGCQFRLRNIGAGIFRGVFPFKVRL